MNVENVYKFRSYISELYKKDTSLEGDLIENVYDSFGEDIIERFSVDIYNGQIEVVIKGNNTYEDLGKVISKIGECIQKFVLDNTDSIKIPENEKDEFNNFVNSGILLFDHFIIANVIKISL